MTGAEFPAAFSKLVDILVKVWEWLVAHKCAGLALLAALVGSSSCWLFVEPTVAITSPKEGAEVESPVTVTGTAAHLSCRLCELIDSMTGRSAAASGRAAVWVVLYSVKYNRYYPFRQPSYVDATNETWHESIAVGTDRDCGNQFKILALVADRGLQETLMEELQKPSFEGLPHLPAGAPVYQEVSVTRLCR